MEQPRDERGRFMSNKDTDSIPDLTEEEMDELHETGSISGRNADGFQTGRLTNTFGNVIPNLIEHPELQDDLHKKEEFKSGKFDYLDKGNDEVISEISKDREGQKMKPLEDTQFFKDFIDKEINVDMKQLDKDMFKEIDDPFNKTLAKATSATITGIHFDGFGTVFGGPYNCKPIGMKGIKLAPEVDGDADYYMEVKDFSIPSIDNMDKAILMGLKFLQENGAFYVGCMMGQGRTGTYIACMLKVFGYQNPVAETRQLYNPKAVETLQQEEFVEDYPVEKFEYLVRFMK